MPTCESHQLMSDNISAVRTDVEVIKNSMKDLVDRMDRNGRAVNELATSINDKLTDHTKILFGDNNTRGIITMSKESFDYMQEAKSNFNTRWNGAIQIFIASVATITLIMMGFK